MGPVTKPRLATMAQRQSTQTRSLALNISSILPITTVVGIAETIPLKRRPMTTPDKDGTAATMAQEMLYSAVLST
ncbi:unnamed protein product [Aspergillus oryzae]|uniref:Unnamed protein product n=2 Tax=Aspergillus oryzae TaxID=5062 RepID=A0AAN4YTA2_ASPOZ|nr:unnamed protein product [Aspergillus oryzae]GMF89915.1 unnamed protein product [Aspergillus oryzae]GMG12177.1 unnamed protein product [Aspergillus oryzae]GMG33582.1 unnamed protein product [Aspergillus oryzae]GMG42064.1 unnamed protein product [Aspergillus oryzae var. brunneus]